MYARSMAWSGGPEVVERLALRLAQEVAPACRAVPGHGWVTAVQMDGEDALTVTSFWECEQDAAPDGAGARHLGVLDEVDGATRVSSSRYDVRYVYRDGATLPGFVVSAASFSYDAERVQDVVGWASQVAQDAQSLPDLNFAVVELADGPRLISVTTWRSREAFDAAEGWLRATYNAAAARVGLGDLQWRRGSVVLSSSGGGTV